MKKILTIEDDEQIRKTIIDLLEAEGFDSYSEDNGIDGINTAKRILPDLIICDIVMPGKTGYEVLEELEKEPRTAAIPFIFLSARAERNDVRQGMELGADDYLIKPFRVNELLKAIDVRLKKNEFLRGSEEPDPKNNVEQNDKSELNENEYVYLTVNNKPRFLKIKNIKCITADSEYSKIFTIDEEKLLVRKLLKNWENILPKNSFLRIHRSTIINLNFVSKIDKWFNNSLVVHLQDMEQEFIISRRYAASIKHKLHYD